VYRRHRSARRRATALRLALPVAAAAGAGGVLIAGQHHASAPDAQHATTHTKRTVQPAVTAVNYVLTVPRHATSFKCLSDQNAPTSGDAWVVTLGRRDCLAIVVRMHVALPSHAQPVNLAGVPGLYQTVGTPHGVRTIYSRNPDGHSWSALSVAAGTPDAKLADFYSPSH
jgi:hypothetical protein